MKIADPDRGWRKFHDDVKKKRENNSKPYSEPSKPQPQPQPPSQPTPQPTQQQLPPQPQQQQPPTVNYTINPPQTTQGNVNNNKPRLGVIIGLMIAVVFVAFLLQPEQTMSVFQTIFEQLSVVWETAQGAMQ